jgi:hypothetical protein
VVANSGIHIILSCVLEQRLEVRARREDCCFLVKFLRVFAYRFRPALMTQTPWVMTQPALPSTPMKSALLMMIGTLK